MQIISNIALISINETLFVQLFSFLIFLFIIDRVMFRPLRKVMGDRKDYVQKVETEIADAEKKLEDVTKKLEKETSAIKQRALDIKEELEEAGKRKASEVFDVTRKEIEEVKESTKKEIDAKISEARTYLKTESETLALRIMEKILDRRLVQ